MGKSKSIQHNKSGVSKYKKAPKITPGFTIPAISIAVAFIKHLIIRMALSRETQHPFMPLYKNKIGHIAGVSLQTHGNTTTINKKNKSNPFVNNSKTNPQEKLRLELITRVGHEPIRNENIVKSKPEFKAEFNTSSFFAKLFGFEKNQIKYNEFINRQADKVPNKDK